MGSTRKEAIKIAIKTAFLSLLAAYAVAAAIGIIFSLPDPGGYLWEQMEYMAGHGRDGRKAA